LILSDASNAAESEQLRLDEELFFLDFIRDIGKHITVNYMMSKDSVKKRLSSEAEGMSFTEFTYQLVQGYDFCICTKNKKLYVANGGSDQWEI
jgi:tyrosyl-tRNA synthetase